MANEIFPASGLPIRRTVDLLPQVFKTETNSKFMAGVVDPLVQPGVLQKTVGYVGRRYGKTYKGSDIYLDSDNTLRSRYQLEPGVVLSDERGNVENFYDYIDFKNQLRFFNNFNERDDLITSQDHYSWSPPIEWDKFVNFREYYWVPSGPPSVKVLGQGNAITSTYRVRQGTTSTWIFYPDGATNNPTLTLYRGQTYNFAVNSPREGFYIRTAFDTGSLKYNPYLPYIPNQLAVYDGKLWRALTYVTASIDGTIVEGPEWELVDENVQTSKFDYFNGVTNNGETNGTVTFEVPLDAPDILYYQSAINPDRFGRFLIQDIEENTSIDIDKEILGKQTYTSSNGIEFTNGLVVRFGGKVTPSKYAKDNWLVEKVGREIILIKFSDLAVPIITSQIPEVIFDNTGFDTDPFDDATSYPGEKDYIAICRASIDANPWSRYNRWFHKSTLEQAHKLNGTDFEAGDSFRAKRPIIEFRPNLQLFNHGSVAKTPVDFIDTFTTDIFSTIEGSQGYSIDGEFLYQGARVLFIADTDELANNKIYQVNFITHNNVRQITLRATVDSDPILGEGILVKGGNANKGLMYHFNGTNWVLSQAKTKVNQLPLFDLFDNNGISFSDATSYPSSSFIGSPILSYKVGNSVTDSELGFSLDYLNIDNVGDILFTYNLDSDNFSYSVNQQTITTNINTGFYRFNPLDEFANGWVKSDSDYLQPILDSVVITEATNQVTLATVDWSAFNSLSSTVIFYLNGQRHLDSYTRENGIFTFSKSFAVNDVVSIKMYIDIDPDQGYYQIPHGLEKNPLNDNLTSFTLGQAIDHLSSAMEIETQFSGVYPGNSNLRNIDGYQYRCMRFLKHSGIAPMAVSLLCDKNINIVKSIQHSLKAYSNFKNEFLKRITENDPMTNIVDFVDEVISAMTVTKDSSDPFADSDMIGSGAHTDIEYLVEDEGIKVFALSQTFNLTELSRRAVYVYRNGSQLVHGTDYTFDSTFGFVRLSLTLVEGDQIVIREYVSTAFNYIPSTPTKLGLYKKYLPRIYLDDTFVTPRIVIQGHDGSITAAFDDYRDDAILELELRIYNNIKQEYNENIFNIDNVFGGYYGNALYTKPELDAIVIQDFLRWVSNTDIDYTNNDQYLDLQNSFTYTYSNMTDPTRLQSLPGYWRGVYQWFYDTNRPHICPWEMLGFSEKPTWWESEYGPAPYTRGNLILWEDIRDGIIRQGPRAGTYARYARPSIVDHIPTDGDGRLLSPLDSGIANDFTLINNQGDYRPGDVSPVEAAWRSSSEWPFSVMVALCLLKPFEFITDSFDRSRMSVNQLGQTVSSGSGVFSKISDLLVPVVGGTQLSGLVTFVSSYVRSKNLDPQVLLTRLNNLDVKISTRMSGFVDQTEQKYLLDSKNPSSTSSSIYVPNENYDVIFNVGVPMIGIAYSGVLIEKLAEGWKIKGYDNQQPYFNYFKPIASSSDPLTSVGGTSVSFLDWAADKVYSNGDVVRTQNTFYRALKSHTSTAVFDKSLWKILPKLPVVGGVDAYFRKTFDQLKPIKLYYGTIITKVQGVVDFLLGYQAYLKTQGFSFDRYDAENQVAYNWGTSCKEFLFWTKHNWAVGSLLTLSPSAGQVEMKIPLGVADSLFDSFYDYQIFKSDGAPLLPIFLNVSRDFQSVKVSTVNTNEGIYFIKVYFVLKEHVTVFDDRTVFNDVIYDKTTGYRQERIKSRGFRTVDWDGDYTSPGFLFDNVTIQQWSPYTDYRLGDIVSYKSFNWVSKQNQQGAELFDTTVWEKLDTTPTKGLVANFDYRINQFEDYYDVDADGLGSSQRDLSRHVIGYQTRDYLQNMAEDAVSQFKLYQGFIREKGTSNAITKVFDKLSRTNSGSIELNEEWAFRVGRFGGTDQFNETEFRILKNDFKINPQPIIIAPTETTTDVLDLYMRVPEKNFTIAPIPFSADINPVKRYKLTPRTAGYVNSFDVDFAVKNYDDILSLNIADFEENSHVWITFYNNSWTVLRYNISKLLLVTDVNVVKTRVEIVLGRTHGLSVGDIFGIRNIENLEGFYKITEVPDRKTIVIQISKDAKEPKWESSTIINLELFSPARFNDYQSVDLANAAALTSGAKFWIDSNVSGNWEVSEKQKLFSSTEIAEYGATAPLGNGSSVLYIDILTQVVSAMPASNLVVSYLERIEGLKPFQIFERPNSISAAANGVFGESLAVSPDGKWLAIGSPRATGIRSDYQEVYNSDLDYSQGDIVLHKGKLWRAKVEIFANDYTGVDSTHVGSDSTLARIDTTMEDWEPALVVTANQQGSNTGYLEQGAVSLYEWSGQNWVERYSFVSPRQNANEQFGSKITIGVDSGNYYMAISAPGAESNKGRVYLYKYAPLTVDTSETITYSVTVAPPQGMDTGYKYYINEQYRPNLSLLVGNTYIFDQTDLSNVYYPNPVDGTVTNKHPLNFSADNISGVLGGGTLYTTGVTYLLDNRTVTQAQYIAGFTTATTRKVRITVTENTASILYYYSSATLNMGNSIIRKFPNIAKEWQQIENQNFKGVYDNTGARFYEAGAIVWYNNYLWQSLEDQTGDGSTISINSNQWVRLDPISTQSSLPTNIALEDDSTDPTVGSLLPDQVAELVKEGDRFGTSMTMSRDGMTLVVGSPTSDGQYFTNYKGVWNSYQTYTLGEVVKWTNNYYRLSSTTSIAANPVSGSPWTLVEAVSDATSGKVYIYKMNDYGFYSLMQTINAGSLPDVNDLSPNEIINAGDLFGYAVDIDNSGNTIVISSPQADINLQNQGSVYMFKYDTDSTIPEYRLKQKLQSYEVYNNELFGFSVSISERGERVVVGAKNTPYKLPTRFDLTTRTRFDGGRTTFSEDQGYPGQVYVFELKDQTYILSEKLEADLIDNEGFGYSLDSTASVIVTGSPNFAPTGTKIGMTRIFRKDVTKNSFAILAEETPMVNIDLLKSVAVYDDEHYLKIADLDIIDVNKLKILGRAEQEIKFKTPYDPATYTNGTDEVSVDIDQAWFEKNVGVIWWNISTAKWAYYEQGDLAYRAGNWNQLAPGASIDICEWVESSMTPADWAKMADTTDGLSVGISGQPLYGNAVYSIKRFTNPNTGLSYGTKYYFWVKGKTITPTGIPGRNISAASIATLIENPASDGTPILAIIDTDKFLTYNLSSVITGDSALINIEYYNSERRPNATHTEYQLLTEGIADSLPSDALEQKWLDSLVGFNQAGNPVPDPTLLPKQRYGLAFRPIQTMFVDRGTALKIVIDRSNDILATRPFADLIDFENLNQVEDIPNATLNLYDLTVDTFAELSEVGIVRISPAVLSANIVDGEIDTVDIVDPGFGYRTAPPVKIVGDGLGAKATVTLDLQGRITSVTVVQKGRKYTNADISVRNFSVLVKNDITYNNYWSIYFWDSVREGFFKSTVQSYDTTKYWSYSDWYATGYSSVTRIVKEILDLYLEPTIKIKVGDVIKVKEYANGGWALLERVIDGSGDVLGNYVLVGRENGTIKIKQEIYNVKIYDYQTSYDEVTYDNQPTQELRYIFAALKENIFLDDLRAEWNKLFFASIRYIFSEQLYVDWAFKTSFLNAIHNIGDLEQKTNYKNDNLSSFQRYLEEVKPFRTTIREYTSRYTDIDRQGAAITDFDVPPAYDVREGQILPVSENSTVIDTYPYKWWKDNHTYSVTDIVISNAGADYKDVPRVVITGNGTGATAQAYIANGSVVGIKMLTNGTGYTTASVSIVGGNGTSTNIAKASAIIGDSKTRTFDLTVKFDRITKEGTYTEYTYSQEFVADGFTAIFELNYPPTRDKTKIAVTVNDEIILDSEYEITFYKSSTDAYSLLRGKLKLLSLPAAGANIIINYEKADEILEAVDRINKYYSPTRGMIGKEINQLMTGIDFGGVQIQGTTFDVSGGWDALPWFTDTWDSVEPNADFYYVVDSQDYTLTGVDSKSLTWKAGSVVHYGNKQYRAVIDNADKPPVEFPEVWEELTFLLPFTPAIGQQLSVYLKRSGLGSPRSIDTLDSAGAPVVVYDQGIEESRTIRIDDINFGGPGVTNTLAVMPTVIGDGSTNSVDVQRYVQIENGDTLIFRPMDSDGTVNITDVNIIDTNLTGGSLSAVSGAYITATGTAAEDIVVDGSKFISPDQVPAPEENVPGQVIDSVSIKVFHTVQTGATPLQSRILKSNGKDKRFDIGLTVMDSKSVMVYVDKVKCEVNSADSSIEYIIDYNTNEVVFTNAPIRDAVIEIISIGIGGAALLDYQEFEADGDTLFFLTRANFADTASIVVTVDGIDVDALSINSSEVLEITNKTLIQFANKPERRQIVKIVCLGANTDVDSSGSSLVRVNQQTITFDGSTLSYDLDQFVNLTRASASGAVLVEVNGIQLKGVDTEFVVYDGTNNIILIGQDPIEVPNTATQTNIQVYVNNELKRNILDYVYNGNDNTITVDTEVLTINDEIKVVVDIRSQYTFTGNNIVFNGTSFIENDSTTTLQEGDQITVTWFSEYPSMNIISDQYSGGKVQYQLAREPVSASYIWVYKNGRRLTQEQDYEVSIPRNVVYLKTTTLITDEIKIVQFGNYLRRAPLGYEVFKDMLNIYHFKRFSIDKTVQLSQDLNYYDQIIYVTDTANLFEPIKSRNIPGTVYINGERIDYFEKTATTLSQLRRGTTGTAIKETHTAGSSVVDVGRVESLPYNESQERLDFVSDGSSLLVGPLNYVPAPAVRASWTRVTIPTGFEPCDQIEVFAGGKRLRKDPVTVYDQTANITSPQADTVLEAEFSVDGVNDYIRLTSSLPAGTRITIIRRIGKTWYDRGETTASAGVTLLKNTSSIAEFLKQKSTELPE
jgi:hypothetical protein